MAGQWLMCCRRKSGCAAYDTISDSAIPAFCTADWDLGRPRFTPTKRKKIVHFCGYSLAKYSNWRTTMTLDEIMEGDAAQMRVDRLKANAKATKERARQMKNQADATGAQLKMRKARQQLAKLRQQSLTKTIKPP